MSPAEPPLPVTIVCATLNAFDAVRLTVRSLLRHTPLLERILIADNGSSDGTLEWLRSVDEVTVVPLDARCRVMQADLAWRRAVADALERRGQPSVSMQPLLRTRRGTPLRAVTEHGATLDWLAGQVSTTYFLTLDSDVEFLADGWLEALVEQMDRDGLAALGTVEPGRGRYRARLAPHLMLLRTSVFRALGATFRGGSRSDDPDELARWRATRSSWYLDLDELDAFPSVVVYPPGALLLERLESAGHRWQPTPDAVGTQFVHYGAMSWGGANDRDGGAAPMRAEHGARVALVRNRLLAYEPA